MAWFAVTQAHGHAWDASRKLREQADWDAHASFMDGLVDDGFVVLGGPLGEDENAGERVLLIVKADSAEAVHQRLAEDPWRDMGLLAVPDVTPWTVLLGAK